MGAVKLRVYHQYLPLPGPLSHNEKAHNTATEVVRLRVYHQYLPLLVLEIPVTGNAFAI